MTRAADGDRLERVTELIDAANAEDPNTVEGQPLAQMQGVRATHWLGVLSKEPAEALSIAVRAHHLRRWELKREDYPEGRAGYLKWRADNKKHQLEAALELMAQVGYDDSTQNRVGELLLRRHLKTDPETQILEDAACLVFCETQYSEMLERIGPKKMAGVVDKTLAKMSPAAQVLAQDLITSGSGPE